MKIDDQELLLITHGFARNERTAGGERERERKHAEIALGIMKLYISCYY